MAGACGDHAVDLSLVVFFAAQVLPGDPARTILGPLAAASAARALSHQLGTRTGRVSARSIEIDGRDVLGLG